MSKVLSNGAQQLAEEHGIGEGAAPARPQPAKASALSFDPLLLDGNRISVWWGNYGKGKRRRLRERFGTVRYQPDQERNRDENVYLVEFERRAGTPRTSKGARMRITRAEKLFAAERSLAVKSTTHAPGRLWTEAETDALVKRVNLGEARRSVAIALGRSQSSVQKQFLRLSDPAYAPHMRGHTAKAPDRSVNFPTLAANALRRLEGQRGTYRDIIAEVEKMPEHTLLDCSVVCGQKTVLAWHHNLSISLRRSNGIVDTGEKAVNRERDGPTARSATVYRLLDSVELAEKKATMPPEPRWQQPNLGGPKMSTRKKAERQAGGDRRHGD